MQDLSCELQRSDTSPIRARATVVTIRHRIKHDRFPNSYVFNSGCFTFAGARNQNYIQMKLTEEFYIQANKTVLKALMLGQVTFPCMVKEREIKRRKTTIGICQVCNSSYRQNNLSQKYCSDCAFQVQRQRYFKRKEAEIEKRKAKTKTL
jgi:hypothetical protein